MGWGEGPRAQVLPWPIGPGHPHPNPPPSRGRGYNACSHKHLEKTSPRKPPLSRLAGVDLTTIEGIEEGTALVILSEIGTDMHRWPSVPHVCSWLGCVPSTQFRAGRCCRGGCAPARIASRSPCALPPAVSTARRVPWGRACAGCKRASGPPRPSRPRHTRWLGSRLLHHGSAYVPQGLDAYEAQYHERKVTTMASRPRR